MVREDSWSVFERIRASLHMARADVICPARKNFELRVRETMKEREGGVGGWKGGGGGGGGEGTLHNECSLMNAAAPFLSRARFLVARLLTAFMITRPNSRKIIYFVTTIFFKKKKKKRKNRIFPTLLTIYIYHLFRAFQIPILYHIDFQKLFFHFSFARRVDRVEHWLGFYRDRSEGEGEEKNL